eukprot:796369-Prorocentrum_minimum.AAC.1
MPSVPERSTVGGFGGSARSVGGFNGPGLHPQPDNNNANHHPFTSHPHANNVNKGVPSGSSGSQAGEIGRAAFSLPSRPPSQQVPAIPMSAGFDISNAGNHHEARPLSPTTLVGGFEDIGRPLSPWAPTNELRGVLRSGGLMSELGGAGFPGGIGMLRDHGMFCDSPPPLPLPSPSPHGHGAGRSVSGLSSLFSQQRGNPHHGHGHPGGDGQGGSGPHSGSGGGMTGIPSSMPMSSGGIPAAAHGSMPVGHHPLYPMRDGLGHGAGGWDDDGDDDDFSRSW